MTHDSLLSAPDAAPAAPARRRHVRRAAVLTAAVTSAALIAACGASSSSGKLSSGETGTVQTDTVVNASSSEPGASALGQGETATNAKPVSGGTLDFGVLDAPAVIDPHEASSYPESIIADNITDKLTWQDPTTGKLYPWLATKWSYNKNFTQFTFYLRKGVTFSNGQPFNASSVVANFNQDALGDAKLDVTPDPTHWAGYLGTTAVNPYEVIVKFSRPNAGFLTFTSFSGDNDPGFVANKTLQTPESKRTIPANVIGTGPFIVKSFTYEQNVVLVRRKGYDWAPAPLSHDGAAYLNEINIETIPEASVRTGALESGKLQATLDVQPTDEASLKAAGYVIEYRPVSGKVVGFDLNASLFPTNDVDVRKAMNYAFDRDGLFPSVLTQSYLPAQSVLVQNVPGFESFANTALKYDPAKAKALLQSDGWKLNKNGFRYKDGKELTVKVFGSNNLVANQAAYEYFQEQEKAIGINLVLSVLPIAETTAAEDDFDTTWNGEAFNTSRDDPSVLWQQYASVAGNASNLKPGNPAYTPINNAVQALQDTLDPSVQEQETKTAQELIVSKYALDVPIYVPSQVIAANKNVHGIVFDAQSRNLFYDTWIAK